MAQPVPKSDTRIDQLLEQCSRLKGRTGLLDELVYGESICVACRKNIASEGQAVEQSMATAEGIYFRCAKKCKCGCSLGFVCIDVDPDVQQDET